MNLIQTVLHFSKKEEKYKQEMARAEENKQ